MAGPTLLRQTAPMIVALGCAYLIAHFYRVSTGVIAPDLMNEVGLSAEALGALSSAFFFAFALAQIPVGVLLDRFGPRLVIPGVTVLAIIGAVIFALSHEALGLAIGRAFMGAGTAAVLMGTLVIGSRWFPPDRFGAVTSSFVALGTVGALLATTPLAFASDVLGWRGAFFGMAVLTLVAGAFVWLVVRDAPPGHPHFSRKPENLRAVWLGLGEVVRNRRLPYILAINSVTYGSTLTIVALWGGPYLTNVHGLDGVGRGNILLLATLGQVVGHVAYGQMDRWLDTRKWLIVGGACCFAIIFAILALVPQMPLWQVAALFTLMGMVSSYSSMITTHGRAIFPNHLVGRGMTTNNMSVFLGAAILQWLSGLVIGAALDAGLSEAEAFRVMFGFLAVLLVIGVSVYSRIDDAKPSADARRHAAELAARAAAAQAPKSS